MGTRVDMRQNGHDYSEEILRLRSLCRQNNFGYDRGPMKVLGPSIWSLVLDDETLLF